MLTWTRTSPTVRIPTLLHLLTPRLEPIHTYFELKTPSFRLSSYRIYPKEFSYWYKCMFGEKETDILRQLSRLPQSVRTIQAFHQHFLHYAEHLSFGFQTFQRLS